MKTDETYVRLNCCHSCRPHVEVDEVGRRLGVVRRAQGHGEGGVGRKDGVDHGAEDCEDVAHNVDGLALVLLRDLQGRGGTTFCQPRHMWVLQMSTAAR